MKSKLVGNPASSGRWTFLISLFFRLTYRLYDTLWEYWSKESQGWFNDFYPECNTCHLMTFKDSLDWWNDLVKEQKLSIWEGFSPTFLPPMSAVEVIESDGCVCVILCVCALWQLNHLTYRQVVLWCHSMTSCRHVTSQNGAKGL